MYGDFRLAQHLPDDSGWRAAFVSKGNPFVFAVCRLTLVRIDRTVYDHDQNILRLWKLRSKIGNRVSSIRSARLGRIT